MHQAAQKGARGHHHGLRIKINLQVGGHPDCGAIAVNQRVHRRLKQVEIGLQLQHMLHPVLVGLLVALCARRLHGGSLAGVQQTKLYGGGVGIDRHLAPEGIDFTHHVPLGLAANRGIAAHLRDGV